MHSTPVDKTEVNNCVQQLYLAVYQRIVGLNTLLLYVFDRFGFLLLMHHTGTLTNLSAVNISAKG